MPNAAGLAQGFSVTWSNARPGCMAERHKVPQAYSRAEESARS